MNKKSTLQHMQLSRPSSQQDIINHKKVMTGGKDMNAFTPSSYFHVLCLFLYPPRYTVISPPPFLNAKLAKVSRETSVNEFVSSTRSQVH